MVRRVVPLIIALGLTHCRGTVSGLGSDDPSGDDDDDTQAAADSMASGDQDADGADVSDEDPVPTDGPPVVDCSSWAPTRDAQGEILNFAAMPANAWFKIPDSTFVEHVKPVLDAGGYTLYRYGTDGLAATFTNYNGMAWEEQGPYGYAHGGGHEGGSDNGIYRLDRRTMRWSVSAFPTRVGTDGFTQEDAELYGQGAHWGGTSMPASRFAYPRSSTGYAMRYAYTFSQWGWYEAPAGPVGYNTIDTQAEFDSIIAGGVQLPFPPFTDIMQDGKPTSRHVYQGLQVDETRGNFIMASRAFWKARLNGDGWLRYQDGGRTSFVKNTGELIWTFIDEATGKLWQGGCGSNCYVEGYYFYGGAQVFDPADNAVTTGVSLLPAYTPTNLVNVGDLHLFVIKVGRVVYALARTGFSVSMNLDDLNGADSRVLYRPPVSGGYAGNLDEGNSALAIDANGVFWAVDTHDPSLPTWEYDYRSPAVGAPFTDDYGHTIATKVPLARRRYFAQCGTLPAAAAGLVYSRMQYWRAGGVVVYVPNGDDNVWVMRPSR